MSGPELALLGGSLRPGSFSVQVLRVCAELAARQGAHVTVLPAPQLGLPLYEPGCEHRTEDARRLLAAVRRADGLIVATPVYHGGMSGLLKNALDYLEDLSGDAPAYLDGRATGAVAVGWSEHGAAHAVAEVRNAIMCLRGWVTPMSVTVNSADMAPTDDAVWSSARTVRRLEIMVGQVTEFAARNASLARA
ncbi:NADPH-dependent FMN reductase [Streptomyces iconiensis]|uniref:NAD(P)H-dependent oxidoreductase n=1 Tax=Streptomyces iconiensis TaxID=1384038 RepID=A0ABT6ZY35_9ACTN|nr:NAD(P)H-dependent oxidoreductase [Streptomyces iconiensis]MDJ1133984.1 NAD(P)H-dependent oxidoreductase [Streptomyces iconiensis]